MYKNETMELLDIIQKRWSPRSYAATAVTQQQLDLVFEAARWAPSSNNEQEWEYYYATADQPEAHAALAACMVDSNRAWAEKAPVIILSVGRKAFARNGKPNRHWMHDVGAANVSMALQAASMGLQLHQMAGFSIERCEKLLCLDLNTVEPVTMMTLGVPDSADKLPSPLREREVAPRTRKPASEFVHKL